MLTFQEFTKAVENQLPHMLPEEFDGVRLSVMKILPKGEKMRTAIVANRNDIRTKPIIYLEEPYHYFKDCSWELSEVLTKIAWNMQNYQLGWEKVGNVNPSSYNFLKGRISASLHHYREIKRTKNYFPHKVVGMAAVLYEIDYTGIANLTGKHPLKQDTLDYWGIDVEKIHKQAMKNMKVSQPNEYQLIKSILKEQKRAEQKRAAKEQER